MHAMKWYYSLLTQIFRREAVQAGAYEKARSEGDVACLSADR